ncbi:hypothetical protein LIA77_09940 [Sarocladium implicatum]|nr:hypothetical protein LIA77_09940 [Sarocladium implicatum]
MRQPHPRTMGSPHGMRANWNAAVFTVPQRPLCLDTSTSIKSTRQVHTYSSSKRCLEAPRLAQHGQEERGHCHHHHRPLHSACASVVWYLEAGQCCEKLPERHVGIE